MGGDATIGRVLTSIVRTAAAEIDETLPAALADDPDGVHQHRVRVRRLRSVLAAFGDLMDRRAADRVRVRYAEWGTQLGVVRDIEVSAAVAEEALAEADIDDPLVTRRLVVAERREYAIAHARLKELGTGARAAERARELHALAASPGVVAPDDPASELVARVLKKQARRVRNAMRRLDESDAAHHDVRKAARRVRYVAEAVAEAAPGLHAAAVEGLAQAGDALHDALGSHRDAVLFAAHLRREAVRAGRAGEAAEVYEHLAAEALHRAHEHLAGVPKALDDLRHAASRLP